MPRKSRQASQISPNQSKFPHQEVNEPREINITQEANDVVRYIICRNGLDSSLIKTADIKKVFVATSAKHFDDVIQRSRKILRSTYGFHLAVINENSMKGYLVSNCLPYKEDPTENNDEIPEDVNKILLMLILAHIFMSNNTASEQSLHAFLKSLDIDVNIRHSLFGNVKEFLTKIIKQRYICSEFDEFTKKTTFSWAMRAEAEVSKMGILEFVSEMYGSRTVQSWTAQYEAAGKQVTEIETL